MSFLFRIRNHLLLIVVGGVSGTLCMSRIHAEDAIEFNRDVRPILSEKCFACHGPDAKSREAELRLDQPGSAFGEKEGRAAIRPGNPAQSELVHRITAHEDAERMPPAGAGKPLTDEEIALLKKWIEQGANWESHWAYLIPQRPEVPQIDQTVPSPIDQFLLRKLVAAETKANPRSEARTLIRRLSFDLTGLPPTADEVDQFVSDPSPGAYEALVDRLLQSPHYGERMAMYWLDLVRYADTLGYHGDQVRSVSPYRDYVIDSFNRNHPFDEFTIEQIAGDLLPNASLSQKVASTYNRLNRASAEGGLQPKEYLAKYAADRVRTTAAVWLGSTLGCAECHDHKFDPFSTKDFYSFAAFFADVKEQGIVSGANYIEQLPVPTAAEQAEQTRLTAAISEAESDFRKTSSELEQAFLTWQADAKVAAERWTVLTPDSVASQHGATLTVSPEGIVSASGSNPDQDVYTVNISTELNEVGALRFEVLTDPSLPAQGPGRAANGNFVVNSLVVSHGEKNIEWASATGTHGQGGFVPNNLATGSKGWAILPKVGENHQVILEAKTPLELTSPESTSSTARSFTIRIVQNHGTGHNLGRFRISVSEQSAAVADSLIPTPEIAKVLEIPSEDRTESQTKVLDAAFRSQTTLLKQERERLVKLKKQKEDLDKQIVTTLVTVSTTPREMRVLPRGDWMSDAGKIVTPNFPEFLTKSQASDKIYNRRDLANWLVSNENPLVARTYVNRLWMLFFGEGICRSVDDLGSQGSWPTHPDLLDWLAVEFMDSGWDVKHLVKRMVMSSAYQQSSTVSEEQRQRDPYNLLFARQTSHRLDAEMIRDNALFISGLLVDKIGGVSAKPYQPAGYWDQLNFPKRTYQQDNNANQYRRGIYTHWQRTYLHPSLLAFDAPAREECTARRERSNTPLQALVLMNDPTFVESARVLAEEVVQRAETGFHDRLHYVYRKCLARMPTASEEAVLENLYQQDFARFAQRPAGSLEELLSTGLAPPAGQLDQTELAAWTSVTRVLLNLHETITRY